MDGSGLACEEGVALHVVRPSLGLASSAAEGVDWRADPDVGEPDGLEEGFPACARQATCDSASPEVDVPLGLLRNGVAVGDHHVGPSVLDG